MAMSIYVMSPNLSQRGVNTCLAFKGNRLAFYSVLAGVLKSSFTVVRSKVKVAV